MKEQNEPEPPVSRPNKTRMIKVTCPLCGCIVRMTRVWLDKAGPPSCGCGGYMEEAL